VRLVTSFLLDRWIVLALPSEGLSHETCPVLLHSENFLEELAANGCHECAQRMLVHKSVRSDAPDRQ